MSFRYEPHAPDALFGLNGAGVATAQFTVLPFDAEFGGQQYLLTSLRYDFGPTPAPVPEPGTIMLLASGLLAFMRKRR